jgi:hypothetical protein
MRVALSALGAITRAAERRTRANTSRQAAMDNGHWCGCKIQASPALRSLAQ